MVHIPVQPTLTSTVQNLLNLSKLHESLGSYLSLTSTDILPTFHILQDSNNILQPLTKLQFHDQVHTNKSWLSSFNITRRCSGDLSGL